MSDRFCVHLYYECKDRRSMNSIETTHERVQHIISILHKQQTLLNG